MWHESNPPGIQDISDVSLDVDVLATSTSSRRQGRAPSGVLGRAVARFRSDSLLRNSVYIMGTTLVTSFLGYVYWILAARTYSTYDVGLASSLISAMTITSILSNVGVGSALIHRLPKCQDLADWTATLNAGLLIVVASGLVSGVSVAILLPRFLPQYAILTRQPLFGLTFIACIVLWNVSTILDQTFVAERASSNMLARNAIFALLKIALLVVPILFLPAGAFIIFASWTIGAAVAAIASRFLLIPLVRPGYRFSLKGVGRRISALISSLAGQHFINIGGIAPMYLLPVVVTVRLSTTESAYFYTAWMVGSLCFLFSPAVASSLFAEGAHSHEGLVKKVWRSALIIMVLLAVGGSVLAYGGKLILSIFGAQYATAGYALLLVLVISAIPDAVTNLYVSAQRIHGRVYGAAALNLSMASITLVSSWFLLPRVGLVGAGLGWLLAQSAGSVFVGFHLLIAPLARRVGGMGRERKTWAVAEMEDTAERLAAQQRMVTGMAFYSIQRAQRTGGLLFDMAEMPAPIVPLERHERASAAALSGSGSRSERQSKPSRPKLAFAMTNLAIIGMLIGGLAVGHLSQPVNAALDVPSSGDLTPLPLLGGTSDTPTATTTRSGPPATATPTRNAQVTPSPTRVGGDSTPLAVSSASLASPSPGTSGPCASQVPLVFPATLTFPAANRGGTVTYHWVHSDGSTESVQHLTVQSGTTSATVRDTWNIPATEGTGQTLSDQLVVTSPNLLSSNGATYQLTCPFQVTGIQLTANPASANAPCPQTLSFTFTGTISVTSSPGGTISYTWTKPDGTTKSDSVTVPANGETLVTVYDTWSPTPTPANGSYTESLTITAPSSFGPDSATVTIAC